MSQARGQLQFELIKRTESLTVTDIKQMHQALLRSVDTYTVYALDPSTGKQVVSAKPLEKGKYKEVPNSPQRQDGSVHEYCPPLDVAPEMSKMVDLYEELSGKQTDPVANAAWLHHAFTQIHPFQDGNGRVARMLASFVLIKAGLPAFTVIPEMKQKYIAALELADQGRPHTLVDFVESCVHRQAVRMWHELRIGPAAEVPKGSSLEEILQAARTKLAAKHELLPVDWKRSSDILQKYREITKAELFGYANKIHDSIRKLKDTFHANPGNTTFARGSLSVAWAAQWGDDLSQSDVEAQVISIQMDQLDQIIVGFDSFHPSRHGLGGVFVALKRGESEERIDGCFLLHFKSEERVSHFQKWLTLNLNEAVRLWQQRLA